MPRASAEARGAAAFRAGGRAPEPPKHLSKAAAEIWRAVAASKPADWFDAGAMILLEDYCNATIQARAIETRMAKLRAVEAWDEMKAMEKRAALSTTRLTALATKLRVSVQALIERHSRKIVETGAGETAADPLIGGTAVWGEGDDKKLAN